MARCRGGGRPTGWDRYCDGPAQSPFDGAVYVKVSVVGKASMALVGETLIVPTPSGGITFTCGEEAIEVSVPPLVDFSCTVKVFSEFVDGGMALFDPPPEP